MKSPGNAQPTADVKSNSRRLVVAGGFPSLRRKIIGWTSNLLAAGLVIVAALGLGSQLASWWGVDGGPPATAPSDKAFMASDLGDGELTWHLGDADGGLIQETVQGPREAALKRQLAQCRQALESTSSEPPSLARDETALLERLQDRKPIEELPGKWRLHRFDGQMPLAVGVQSAPAATISSIPGGEQLVAPRDRVLVWSLAVPQGQDRWTLYCFRAAAATQGTAEEPRLPPPPGARRTLSLSSAHETMSAVSGSGTPGEWARHFDGWFAARGWRPESWRVDSGAWRNRFVNATGGAAVVQFKSGDDGKVEGLLIETHAALPRNEKDGR